MVKNKAKHNPALADLLDLSHIVQQTITSANIDGKIVVEQQCVALEAAILEANATINIVDDLHNVSANQRLLSECVLNLLSNAISYREPSRPLVIEIFTTQTSLSTTIHVKDNGIGIDPKYHHLIFGLFERLSVTKGSGVGLKIVETIMQKHKGRVLIDSQLGEGCCFSLEFPNIDQGTNIIAS